MIRTYSELKRFTTFEDRYDYLRLGGGVGASTFGFDRHLNQGLYHSTEWRHIRREVILRDNGCDLGSPGYEIHGGLLVHHMNPINSDDIIRSDDSILDPEFLITTTSSIKASVAILEPSNLILKSDSKYCESVIV